MAHYQAESILRKRCDILRKLSKLIGQNLLVVVQVGVVKIYVAAVEVLRKKGKRGGGNETQFITKILVEN
jgi:hypothetical protein